MKIGVSGASGLLGRAVVSELLQRRGGQESVAITRTPFVFQRRTKRLHGLSNPRDDRTSMVGNAIRVAAFEDMCGKSTRHLLANCDC
jgi:uncharacterized protein YbjT (DUF2867 family)